MSLASSILQNIFPLEALFEKVTAEHGLREYHQLGSKPGNGFPIPASEGKDECGEANRHDRGDDARDDASDDASDDDNIPYETPQTFASYFKFPIVYQKNIVELGASVCEDLELISPNTSNTEGKGLYEIMFDPHDIITRKSLHQWSQYYTHDHQFIRDTIQIIKSLKFDDKDYGSRNHDDVYEDILKIKQMKNFVSTYNYFDVPFLPCDHLNCSSVFLQVLTITNMTSPILALLVPIMMLFVPFFILKLRGINICLSSYITTLKTVLKQSNVGKMIYSAKDADIRQKGYVLFSFCMYVYQMYQNALMCWRFHRNLCKIHTTIIRLRSFIRESIDAMKTFIDFAGHLPTYGAFCSDIKDKIATLEKMHVRFSRVSPYKIYSFHKVFTLGGIMKDFFEIYHHKMYDECIRYSFGFVGYVQNILRVQRRIADGEINYCSLDFTQSLNAPSALVAAADDEAADDEAADDEAADDEAAEAEKAEKAENTTKNFREYTEFIGAYYPGLIRRNKNKNCSHDSETSTKNDEIIRNSYSLGSSMIVTGPNASGKTTHIKTVLCNIIFSQQLGCGFYKQCNLVPYHQIHCYMNIPDTSARDSLFQAEARRCKTIIDDIQENKNGPRHLCIFDELYSGTNPYEAVGSAYAFLQYISNMPKRDVTYLLTTHYLELCKEMNANHGVRNYHMDVQHDKEHKDVFDYNYTYKLKNGISKVKGGIKVLHDLSYPDDIIATARKYI